MATKGTANEGTHPVDPTRDDVLTVEEAAALLRGDIQGCVMDWLPTAWEFGQYAVFLRWKKRLWRVHARERTRIALRTWKVELTVVDAVAPGPKQVLVVSEREFAAMTNGRFFRLPPAETWWPLAVASATCLQAMNDDADEEDMQLLAPVDPAFKAAIQEDGPLILMACRRWQVPGTTEPATTPSDTAEEKEEEVTKDQRCRRWTVVRWWLEEECG